MLRLTRTFASSLAILAIAAAMAPATANAWPIGKVFHVHPATGQTQDARISVKVYNQAYVFRDVKVDGHVYTVMPHHGLVITAPAGTQVYAASTGFSHRRGDLLLTVTPATKDQTVYIN